MLHIPAKSPQDLPSIFCPSHLPKRDAVRAQICAFKKLRDQDSPAELAQAEAEVRNDLCPGHLPNRFAVLAQIEKFNRNRA